MRETAGPIHGSQFFAGSLALCVLWAAPLATAQNQQTSKPRSKSTPKPTSKPSLAERRALAQEALAEWVAVADIRKGRDEAVRAVLDAEAAGLALLAGQRQEAEGRRLERLDAMIGYVGLNWLDQVERSGMVYPGQYESLRPLMPSIGEFYLELILETPQDYPITRRERVVAAVRDLYPKGPSIVVKDQVLAMATDTDEPKTLRTGLAYALAQWGDRKLIRSEIRALEKQTRSKDDEIALIGMRRLAQIQYAIRDYAVAAIGYRDFIRKAQELDGYLLPVHYYNAACCMSLSGDKRSAFEFVRQSLVLNKSPRVDSSVRLGRNLFERDPEIAKVREMKGFRTLLDDAFGKKEQAADGAGSAGGKPPSSGRTKSRRSKSPRPKSPRIPR